MHPSEILANIELVPNRIILDPQLSVQKFACDYSALRRVPSLVRNPLCEYATLLNLVEFKTENKESYLEIFLQFNGLIQKDAVVMFQFFDILDTNFVFSSSVNIHISLLCMVRNDALMRFHIQDGIDSGGGYGWEGRGNGSPPPRSQGLTPQNWCCRTFSFLVAR